MTHAAQTATWAAEPRPSSVRVIAFVGTCLGLAGMLGLLWRVFEVAGGGPGERRDVVGWWPIVTASAGVALSALLLMGSLGAFRLRPAARAALMGYAVASLVVGAVSLVLYYRAVDSARRSVVFNWGGMGALFEMLYWPAAMLLALYVLYSMTRPHVRAAFARGPIRTVDEGR